MSEESVISSRVEPSSVPAEPPRQLHIRVTELEGLLSNLGKEMAGMQTTLDTTLERLATLEREVGLL